jgi:RNA polymerase sigma factor (sigma-70 family)
MYGVFRRIHRVVGKDRGDILTDCQLLQAFSSHRDEAAFEELVIRHGPMVLGVCRRALGDLHEAEDVFQATFLVLARKAASMSWQPSAGCWLHEVAYRLSMKSRAVAGRRKSEVGQLPVSHSPDPLTKAIEQETREVIDEEVQRLPRRYRAPIILCYFEGHTTDQAARQLGWSAGSVRGRLARARERLRARLSQRGIAGAEFEPVAKAPSAVPLALLSSTVRIVVQTTASQAVVAGTSTAAARMASDMLRTMFMSKVKAIAVALAVLTFGVAGAGLVAHQVLANKAAAPDPEEKVQALGRRQAPQARPPRVDRYGDPLPAGASVRLGTIRFRTHWTELTNAFTPDGKHLVVSDDGVFHFLDIRTGLSVRDVPVPADASWHWLEYSKDGSWLATAGMLKGPNGRPSGSDVALRIWDATTLREQRTIQWKGNSYSWAFALAPDSKTVAFFDSDGVVHLWDIRSGAEILRTRLAGKGGGGHTPCLRFSPDGKILAVGGNRLGEEVVLWEWQAATEPRYVKTPRGGADSMCFSPDGKTLASAGRDRDGVLLREVPSGNLVRRLPIADSRQSWVDVVYAPDGKTLAATSFEKRAILVYDAASGKLLRSLEGGGHYTKISPDSTLLAAWYGTSILVWRLGTGEQIGGIEDAHLGTVEEAAFSPKGNTIATVGGDGTLRTWDSTDGRQRLVIPVGDWPRALAYSADGRWLAVSPIGEDDRVEMIDAATGKVIYRLEGHGRTGGRRAIAFTEDGKRLLSWGDDMYLNTWDTASGKRLEARLLHLPGVVMPDKSDKSTRADALREQSSLLFFRGVFSSDGRSLVIVAHDGFHVFDTATGTDEIQIPYSHGFFLAGMAFSPDRSLLLTSASSSQQEIGVWNLKKAKNVTLIHLDGAPNPGPVTFSEDGKMFAVGSGSPKPVITLRETATGKEITRIEKLPGPASCLAFSPDGKRLAAGLDDSTALVWELDRLIPGP